MNLKERKAIIAGNWKLNKRVAEIPAFTQKLQANLLFMGFTLSRNLLYLFYHISNKISTVFFDNPNTFYRLKFVYSITVFAEPLTAPPLSLTRVTFERLKRSV